MPNTQARRSGFEASCVVSGGTILLAQSAQPGITLNNLSRGVSDTVTLFDCTKCIPHHSEGTKTDRTDAREVSRKNPTRHIVSK